MMFHPIEASIRTHKKSLSRIELRVIKAQVKREMSAHLKRSRITIKAWAEFYSKTCSTWGAVRSGLPCPISRRRWARYSSSRIDDPMQGLKMQTCLLDSYNQGNISISLRLACQSQTSRDLSLGSPQCRQCQKWDTPTPSTWMKWHKARKLSLITNCTTTSGQTAIQSICFA